jgi:hypothetical protein
MNAVFFVVALMDANSNPACCYNPHGQDNEEEKFHSHHHFNFPTAQLAKRFSAVVETIQFP